MKVGEWKENTKGMNVMESGQIAITEMSPCEEVVYLSGGNMSYEEWCSREATRIRKAGKHANIFRKGNACCLCRPRNECRTSGGYLRKPKKNEVVIQ